MTDRQRTHSYDCWGWGPGHYDCAVAEIRRLSSELRQAMDERDAAQAEARNWKRIAEDATHVEREELTRLRGLLGAARCPNCDGSGAIPHGPTPDGDWEAEQCQWCYEKQEALAAGGDQ